MKKTLIAIIFITLFSSKTTFAAVEDLPDCNEGLNRSIFSFNMSVDKYFFKPIAEVYTVLPVEVRSGINNALLNIDATLTVPTKSCRENLLKRQQQLLDF